MTTVREIMTPDPACVSTNDTIRDAAGKIADQRVGSLPITGEDNQLKGMITDRDVVVRVLAEGKDSRAVQTGELAQGEPVTAHADEDIEDAMSRMTRHQVRRLPVLNDEHLVGIVAQADVARSLRNPDVGDLVEALSEE